MELVGIIFTSIIGLVVFALFAKKRWFWVALFAFGALASAFYQ